MASIGHLIRVVAEVSGLEEGSVKLIARYIREAGFIGQVSTGAGAARMTAKDAAALFIAVNGSGLAKDSAAAVEHFFPLPLVKANPGQGSQELAYIVGQLEEAGSFGNALSRLIELYMPTKAGMSVFRQDPRTAAIKSSVRFERPDVRGLIYLDHLEYGDMDTMDFASLSFESEEERDDVDREIVISISSISLFAIANLLAN